MKWYFWVLIVVALLITIIIVAATINSGKSKVSKVETDVVNSTPDTIMTAKSAIYQSLGRIADKSVVNAPCTCTETVNGVTSSWGQNCPCPSGTTKK